MSSFFGLVPIFIVVSIQLRSVSSLNLTNEYLHHTCINSQGKFNKGSVYEKNLNIVIRTSTSGNFRRGTTYTYYGDAPNTAYVQLQCRGDSYWAKCHSCVATAISGIRKRCPGYKGAIIWYDQCVFIISPINSYGQIDRNNKFLLSNPNKVTGNVGSFNKETSAFLETMINKATSKSNVENRMMVLYAAGEKMIETKKVYAMAQCMKDLDFESCNECLKWLLKDFPKCCDGKLGGRVLSTNCNFRYEIYPFLRA